MLHFFLVQTKNIPDTSPGVENIKIFRVQTPTETGNPARDFYLDIMEQISLENIGEIVNKTVESFGRDAFEQTLRRTMVSSDFTNALLDLGDFTILSCFESAAKCILPRQMHNYRIAKTWLESKH